MKMKFKGFDDWIEIFRGGPQTDSSGKEHDGDAVIDKALATFDPQKHEPPLTVGHPVDNAPAFGWVDEVKEAVKDGAKVLLAKFKQVVPEFEDIVKQGLFKKRSASFYPDGRLRHVGFLGAAPPAVKGLTDLKFEEHDEAVTFDFYDGEGLSITARIFRRMRDWLIEKEGKDKADEIIPDWDVEYIKDMATEAMKQETQTDAVPTFSAATSGIVDGDTVINEEGKMQVKEKIKSMLSFMGVDVSKIPDDAIPDGLPTDMEAPSVSAAEFMEKQKKAISRARAEERQKVESEYAEKDRTARQDARQKEISTWCDTLVEKGTLAPAWVKHGLPEILSFLSANEDVVEFGDASEGGTEKASYYDRLKSLFETEIPKLVEFKEIATRDKDTGDNGKRDQLIDDYMEKNQVGYREAALAVAKKNPQLFKGGE